MVMTMTSREFNQRVSAAKTAALDGPVVVTDRGHPEHVLLTYEAYLDLTGGTATLAAAFTALPNTGDIVADFRRAPDLPRPAVFD